jgi:hypothetical protein
MLAHNTGNTVGCALAVPALVFGAGRLFHHISLDAIGLSGYVICAAESRLIAQDQLRVSLGSRALRTRLRVAGVAGNAALTGSVALKN